MAEKLLLQGGCVLTLGSKTANFPEADVLIEDGKIAEVAPRLRVRHAEIIDTRDRIVMPGFVDCHRHVWRSLLRNAGDEDRLAGGWADAYQPDDLYAATLIGLLGALGAGITTVVDWSDLRDEPNYLEAALQAHADAGARSVFVPASGEGRDASALPRLFDEGTALPPDTTIAAGQGAASDSDRLAAACQRARRLGARIHVHASGHPSEGRLIARMAEGGLLGEDVTVVHCSAVGAEELDALAASKSAVALTPSSDMAMGGGHPPIQGLIDRGIRPGLGVDDELLSPGDMFAQMRAVISIQHAVLFDLKLAGKGAVPRLLTTREVIRYATTDGARAAGLRDVTGSLEPGKAADLLVLRTDRPNISPINDPIGAVVWGMDTSNLDWVFVGGRAVMADGVPATDVEEARRMAVAAQERVTAGRGMVGEARPGGPG